MRTLLLGLFSLLLVACGFQLQGNYKLPADLQQLRIDAPQFSEFAATARERFRLAGAELVHDSSVTTVEIVSDSLTRRTLSLSASGQVAEYELIYTVNYLLRQQQGQNQALQVEVFRDYQDDPNFALAKTREREVLVAEMREQAAQQLVRQVIAKVSE
ncbi:LPS-assembly lipoprotein LptE [Pseudidiomarina piscicola]|uniref:LPS-assembly lipoprotein LptE n=1 Tax=Pseudidiomarina piscicola TaxID=2614830 RepID=A0A6S6WJN1_9GAMM|nr:LPS assembly lipoprotein LptE [Pseudidiomarina piscicola]CAB0149616.1 LPS-assembly lipoprotein LptE [Pseudidiomarina piscicola]VZT39064.1 LPS-assembly lipoprotein LptE [Pseudomonas aeruginosa]